ncbi:MAG: hypothetical protein R2728_03990 [Chitinophagales bacterium]
MKVAFILDPSINQDILKQYLSESYKFSTKYYDVSNNYGALHEIRPDLIFMSTNINGQCGFNLINEMRIIDFNLVIISPNERSAIKAFKYGALHYIVAPITPLDIVRVQERLSMKKSISTY